MPYLCAMRPYLLLLLSLCAFPALAQLGIKGGIHTTRVSTEKLEIFNPGTFRPFELDVNEIRVGYQFGAYYRIYLDQFVIQPEVVLNTHSSRYTFQELGFQQALEENYQFLDIPVMFGYDFGVLNLFAGPVGHIFMGSTSELKDLDGYKQNWEKLTWGWQAGLSFDIWRLNLDLRYEGNFYRYGEHIEFFGNSYNFSNRPNRIITAVGFRFGS